MTFRVATGRPSMRLPETRDVFARELELPISREAVYDRVGDVRLDAPTGEGETISDVSGRCGEEEFASADELHDALVGFVSDEYVGRKFYDDRGSQPSEPEEEMSF